MVGAIGCVSTENCCCILTEYMYLKIFIKMIVIWKLDNKMHNQTNNYFVCHFLIFLSQSPKTSLNFSISHVIRSYQQQEDLISYIS